MVKRTLNFWGTAGEGMATLEIDRTGPIDLTKFFENAFNHYFEYIAIKELRMEQKSTCVADRHKMERIKQYQQSRYDIQSTKAEFRFSVEEFFSTFLYRYKPKDLEKFITESVIDVTDFGNETLIKRLENFENDYVRVRFEYDGPHFRIYPIDKITPAHIERISYPNKRKYTDEYRIKSSNEFHTKCDAEFNNAESSQRERTRIYKFYREDKVEDQLRKNINIGKIIKVYPNYLPNPDYFSIIHQYNLPINHLEIVEKKTNT